MTVKDFIKKLLDCDLDKNVSMEYPNYHQEGNNYYRYEDTENFDVIDCDFGVVLGVREDGH